MKELFQIVEESPGKCRVYAFGHGFERVGARVDAEQQLHALNGSLQRWLGAYGRPAPRPAPAPAPVAPEPDLPPVTSIVALTSLSPDPKHAERQRTCVASWLANGCDRVIAFQSEAEIRRMGAWEGVEIVTVEPSKDWGGRLIPIDRLASWAVQYSADETAADREPGHVMIINADCELECGAENLRRFAAEARDGLTYLVRHETNGTRCASGVDAFLMRATNAAIIPPSETLVMGRCHWDHVLPAAFVKAGLPVCSPAFRVLSHVTHPNRWAPEDHARTGQEAARLLGGPVTYAQFASKTRVLPGEATPRSEQRQTDEGRAQAEQWRALHPHGF